MKDDVVHIHTVGGHVFTVRATVRGRRVETRTVRKPKKVSIFAEEKTRGGTVVHSVEVDLSTVTAVEQRTELYHAPKQRGEGMK